MSSNEVRVQDGLLTVRRADEGAHVRLSLAGELDLSNVPTVEAALEGAIDAEKKVLIDLGRLEFLDSTGLALIVRTLQRRDAERFSFLPSRSNEVCRLLALTGVDERMVFASTEPTPQLSLGVGG